MKLQLSDEPAIVFGAARGIGHAVAKAFADEGACVTLADISPSVTDAAKQLGGAAEVVDVTDFATVKQLAERVAPVHLVYAVAVGSGKFGFPFWSLDPADWDRVLRVNLIGGVNVAHAFAPAMAEARRGTLLFLASVAGQIGSQTDPPYSAAKAGLINFAQCAAKDLAPFGVRVNALCPGMVRTPLNESVWKAWADRQPPGAAQPYEEWTAEKIRKLVPLNRWQTPEDIAAMAVFLASPRAANVTGQTINVDGGYVMHW